MKRNLLIIFIFITGICVCAYPIVSNYLNEKNSSRLIEAYNQAVENTDKNMLEAELGRALEYNKNLSVSPISDPFTIGYNAVMDSEYKSILSVGGAMGYIEIPKISVKLSVFHGTGEEVLRHSAGHLEGTALPVGGLGTNSVLTAHTGLPKAKLFTDLTALTEGDLFYIHILDEILAYRVDDIRVVLPEKTSELAPAPGMDYCTLLTCTPYGVNSHRLLVRGARTEYNPEEKAQIDKVKTASDADDAILFTAVITSLVMIILIIIVIIIKGKISKKRVESVSKEKL